MVWIGQGEPLAIVGLILACTPQLRELTLTQWSSFRTYCGDIPKDPEHIVIFDLLGLMWQDEAFVMGWIPGLNIQALETNCVHPPQLLKLPKVRNLRFALQDGQSLDLPECVRLPKPKDGHEPLVCPGRLQLTTDVYFLDSSASASNHGCYKYAAALLN